MGYRYYDKANVPVRWPFGFGLSYTSFSFSDLKVDGNTVEATVTNRGSVPGAEVAQLYIAPPQDGVYRPSKELKGFAKVFLQPGESKTVLFKLNDRCFAVWDDGWKILPGEYTLLVGPSSAELPLGITVKKDGKPLPIPDVYKRQAGVLLKRILHRRIEAHRRLGRGFSGGVPHCEQDHRRLDECGDGADYRAHPHLSLIHI